MGLSGIILKKKENTDIYKLISDVKKAAEEAGLEPRINSILSDSLDEEGVYTTANIANTYEDVLGAQQWLMYIYSNDDCMDRFDWIVMEGQLIRAIIIEDIGECEEILLDFLYEYFKLNPEDYFWNELDWYYTHDDIARIKQREFDSAWCYKNPKL